jgi:hypothetical protein
MVELVINDLSFAKLNLEDPGCAASDVHEAKRWMSELIQVLRGARLKQRLTDRLSPLVFMFRVPFSECMLF